jgi:hypothetical protein
MGKDMPPDIAAFVDARPKTPGFMILVIEKGGQTFSEVVKVYYDNKLKNLRMHTSHLDLCARSKKTFHLLDAKVGIMKVVRDEGVQNFISQAEADIPRLSTYLSIKEMKLVEGALEAAKVSMNILFS